MAPFRWTPVILDGTLFSQSSLPQDIIGLEECTYIDTDKSYVKKKKKLRNGKQLIKKKNKKVKSYNKNVKNLDNRNQISNEVDNSFENLENMEAWSSFSIPTSILKAIKELGFEQPTEIQSSTLPAAILGKRDILGAAETGSGKTLAFGIPILSGIIKLKEKYQNESISSGQLGSDIDSDMDIEMGEMESKTKCIKSTTNDSLYALILTPTRELAMQVTSHLNTVAKYTGINIAVVVGGMSSEKQERILKKSPEIVVGTPGRLWELIQLGNEHLNNISNIKFLAIDETDRMLEKGHFQELHSLLEKLNINENCKNNRQNFIFSATLTLIHDLPKHLINKKKMKGKKLKEMTPEQKLQKIVNIIGVTRPKIVDLSNGKGTSGTLTECRISCGIEEKDYYIYYFLKRHPGRTLIFCNSIGCVKRLTTLLTLLKCNPLSLHANLQQRQRLKNLEKFRDVENSVLIATDVAARGLDISNIEHVLHYQMPRTSECYVHRSGRTARATNKGLSLLIMEPNELGNYFNLCKILGKNKDLPTFPTYERYLNAVKDRVNLARNIDKLQLQIRKTNSNEGWLQKAATEMDIVVDGLRNSDKEINTQKKLANFKRKELDNLLSQSIFPKGFNGKYPFLNNSSKIVNESAIDILENALQCKNTNLKEK